MSGSGVGSDSDSSIRALWASVMYQAVMDWIGTGDFESQTERRQAGEAAEEWFSSDVFETGSFMWICSYLRIHPAVIRRQLRSRPLLRELVASQGRRWSQKIHPTMWETRRANERG